MPETQKDKRILVDVKKMNDEEQDAAIDAALDALFGKDEEPPKKKPARGRAQSGSKKKPAPGVNSKGVR